MESSPPEKGLENSVTPQGEWKIWEMRVSFSTISCCSHSLESLHVVSLWVWYESELVYRLFIVGCSRLLEVEFVQRRRLVWMREEYAAALLLQVVAWPHESLELQSCLWLWLRIIRSFVTDGHESRALFSHIINYPALSPLIALAVLARREFVWLERDYKLKKYSNHPNNISVTGQSYSTSIVE